MLSQSHVCQVNTCIAKTCREVKQNKDNVIMISLWSRMNDFLFLWSYLGAIINRYSNFSANFMIQLYLNIDISSSSNH